MNAPTQQLVTAVAICAFGIAGAACATTSETAPARADIAPSTAQTPAPGMSTQTPAPGMSTDTSTSTAPSTSTMPPSATSGPDTSTANASAQSPQARKIFDQLDMNHDGMLSFQEFSRATFESK